MRSSLVFAVFPGQITGDPAPALHDSSRAVSEVRNEKLQLFCNGFPHEIHPSLGADAQFESGGPE